MHSYLVGVKGAQTLFLFFCVAFHLDDLYATVQVHLVGVVVLGERIEFLVQSHVGAELADAYNHVVAFKLSHHAGQLKQGQGLL